MIFLDSTLPEPQGAWQNIQYWLNQALTNHPLLIGLTLVALVIIAFVGICWYYSIYVASRN